MGMEKFAAGVGKATWDNYKNGFFKYLERKAKEGAKRYAPLGKLRDAWMKIDWGFVAQEYLKYIYEFHSQFHVFGMGEQKLKELSTNVFLLDKPEFRRHSTSEKAEKINGLKLVFQDERGEKVFVWGEPGVGKTTFLKQISTYAIENTELIPLFVNIAEWAMLGTLSQDGLLEYLAEEFERSGFENATVFIEYIIEEGIAILLFDGLDEIPPEKRDIVITILEQNKNAKSKIIISCRVDAIQSHLDGFWEVQIAKWDARRINDFIKKRFSKKDVRKKFVEELNDEKKKSLQDFKKNPLLLSLLCSFYKPEKGFPTNRGEIYLEATRHLLSERDRDKRISREPVLDGSTLAQKESLYAHLAYQSFIKEQLYFTQQELEQKISAALEDIFGKEESKSIDSSIVLPKLISQHGILSRRGHRTYTFSHLTFQEYYTAKHTVENVAQGTLEYLVNQITDPRWREVILLVPNMLDNKRDFIDVFNNHIQKPLENRPGLLEIQKWCDIRTNRIRTIKIPAGRCLYWPLITTTLRTLHQDNEPLSNVVRDLNSIFDNNALNLALSIDARSNNIRSIKLLKERIHHSMSGSPSDIEYTSFSFHPITKLKGLAHFLEDVYTAYLLVFTKYFMNMNAKKRSEKLMDGYINLFSYWRNLDTFKNHTTVINLKIPRPWASDVEWHDFGNTLCKFCIKFLIINPNIRFDPAQLNIGTSIIRNYQFFFECFQTLNKNEAKSATDLILKPRHM